ncbi:ABC transporter permease [Roseiterribacter gracilis]|uniref:Spermidine/putrescine ABC transporter permease n=1 Tax=Roseiterribacter gracilis TaxID=2812848 RepID=A0A8S8XA21_9PROT|nr:spermidine/putrescine ABC transporter permease [Rhodospirillales bacterium TMPK1]
MRLSLPLKLVLGAALLVLYAPIAVLIAFSFNAGRRVSVWQGFSFDWYVRAANDARLIEAFGNSLTIAAIATVISTLLGTATAIALWRFSFRGKSVLFGLLGVPVVVPEICLGVALLIVFARTGLMTALPYPASLLPIALAHVAFAFPFVAIVVRARLAGFDPRLIEASRDLGAGEWATLTRVLLPLLRPAMVAGALLAFTLSLDDFVITFFTTGPGTTTFPVLVYSMVRFSVTPEINAASTVLIAVTLALAALAYKFQKPST